MSNISLLFPHIPFFDGFVTTSDDSMFNLIAGSPRVYYSELIIGANKSFTFSGGNSPLLNTYGVPDYLLLLGINDIIEKDGDVDWTVTTTPPDSDTGTITSGDLVQGNIFYTDIQISVGSAITQYVVNLAWPLAVEFKLGKLFLGKAFDFGREPIFRQSKTKHTTERIRVTTSGSIAFEGITHSKANDFMHYIMPYLDSMTFFIRDAAQCYLEKEFTYCRVYGAVIERRKADADISFDFEELA